MILDVFRSAFWLLKCRS